MNVDAMRALSWTLAFLAASVGSCGTTATVETAIGKSFEGEIVGGDQREVIIEFASGRRRAIDRQDITDVDHPGNVAATIGTILTAYGGLNIMLGASRCNSKEPAFCAGLFAPAVVGLALAVYGFAVYGGSVWAMSQPEPDYLGFAIRRQGERTEAPK